MKFEPETLSEDVIERLVNTIEELKIKVECLTTNNSNNTNTIIQLEKRIDSLIDINDKLHKVIWKFNKPSIPVKKDIKIYSVGDKVLVDGNKCILSRVASGLYAIRLDNGGYYYIGLNVRISSKFTISELNDHLDSTITEIIK